MSRKMTPKEIKHIMNALRRASVSWVGRREALARASKKVFVRTSNEGRAIYKLHWKCAACKVWFRNINRLEVDHVVEIGPFQGDWHDFVHRVFCGQDNLRVLCTVCHAKKTSGFNARLRFNRKL